MINSFRTKSKNAFFSEDEQKEMITAIQKAELSTSGEVRLFIESRCKYLQAIDRAKEVFNALKMDQTVDRNGVLIYIALKDKQLAIYGDEGIYKKTGHDFWDKELNKITAHFFERRYLPGIIEVVGDIGAALQRLFPADVNHNKNELPDDIVFGS